MSEASAAAAAAATSPKESLKRVADASPVNDASEAKRTKSASDEPGVQAAGDVAKPAATKPNIFAAAVTKSSAGRGFGLGFGKKATSPGTIGKAAFGGFAAKVSTEGVDITLAATEDGGVADSTSPTGAAAAPKKNLFATAAKSSGFGTGFGGGKTNSSSSLFGDAIKNTGGVAGFGKAAGFGASPFGGAAKAAFGHSVNSVFGSAKAVDGEESDGVGSAKEPEWKVKRDEKPPSSGEEGDMHMCTISNAKLYLFSEETSKENGKTSWEYRERGKGKLTLNDSASAGDNGFSRLVLRQDTTNQLRLNARVWHGMAPSAAGAKGLRFSGVNLADQPGDKGDKGDRAAIWLIKAPKASDVDQLHDLLRSRIEKSAKPKESKVHPDPVSAGAGTDSDADAGAGGGAAPAAAPEAAAGNGG